MPFAPRRVRALPLALVVVIVAVAATAAAGCSNDSPMVTPAPPADMLMATGDMVLPCLRPDKQLCGPFGCPARDGYNWCNCSTMAMGDRYTCSARDAGVSLTIECMTAADCSLGGLCVFIPGCGRTTGYCVKRDDDCNWAGLQYCECDGMTTSNSEQKCGPSKPFLSFGLCP